MPTPRISLLSCLALLMVTAACSKQEPAPPAPAPQSGASAAATLASEARLVTPGKLTVCSDIPYAPFEFNQGDRLTGFDVELIRGVAQQLGLGAEFKATPFDTIIPALAAGNCDLVASATTITDERKQKIAFSQPYFDADQSLLIRAADATKYKALADLKGRKIGVQSGTTGETYAKKNAPQGATVKDFPGAEDLFNALTANDIDAVLQDFPVNQYRALQAKDKFAVTETFKTGEQYGFAMAKDNPKLVQAVDGALGQMRSSGTYDTIYKTWFGER
jgi:polar amino acid transport system substrate-binding protein